MSLITSSMHNRNHCPTVVGVKRLERETVYFLSNRCTHVVPVGYQAECINGDFVNFPIRPEGRTANGRPIEGGYSMVNYCPNQQQNNKDMLSDINAKELWWEPYKLYTISTTADREKAAWRDENLNIHYLEWNPGKEEAYWDKVLLTWYVVPIDFRCIF
jgi:hypothetical protein